VGPVQLHCPTQDDTLEYQFESRDSMEKACEKAVQEALQKAELVLKDPVKVDHRYGKDRFKFDHSKE
jgi:hypothetical protein